MGKRRKRKSHRLFWLITDLIILVLVTFLVVGAINYYQISAERKPIYYGDITNYHKDKLKCTSYDYKIYRIIKCKDKEKNKYNILLWFMEE